MTEEGQLFLGNGEHSIAGIGKLYMLLSDALSLLGSLQQATPDEQEEVDRALSKAAGTIFYRLTGKQVVVVRDKRKVSKNVRRGKL